MTLKECYLQMDGDYEDTLSRLCYESFITRFLIRFLDDRCYTLLADGIRHRDANAAFTAAHTLKGTAANLGLTALFIQTKALTDALRNGWSDEALLLLPSVTSAYERTVSAITALRDSQ